LKQLCVTLKINRIFHKLKNIEMRFNLKALFTVALMLISFIGISNPTKIQYIEYKLENGLHVILHEDRTTPNVVVNIMYHVGAKNEHPERTGFAHFFEHLMFEGSKHIARGEFSKIVEGAGGTLNAYTSFDVTNYYELLPSNQLELGLWLESERLIHPSIDSIGIATQKDVVTEEMKQTRDNRPYGRLLKETLSRAFADHSYRSDVIGADSHIRNASNEDIMNFHNTFYVPNNAVLVITGDINIEQTKKLVEKYFGDIPKGQLEKRVPKIGARKLTAEIRDTVYDNVQIPALIQAYKIPELGHPDYYAVDMLNTLLSQGQSSRLYRRLVDQEQKSLQVMAMPLELEHPGLTLVFAFANMGVDLQEVETLVNEEISKVREEMISENELQKLKNQKESSMVNNNSTIAQRATNLANYHTIYGDASMINSHLDKYMKVTSQDILRVAKEYYSEDNRVVLYWLPKKQ
jgi:zinc protease